MSDAEKKEKKRARESAYYAANKEKILARTSAYYAANKEKMREWHRAYREANREKLRDKNRAYREANKEKIRKRNRLYYEKNKGDLIEKSREYHLMRNYGITGDEYNRILAAQSGGCGACGRVNPDKDGVLCVDHCHESGRIRGLLCRDCNLGIGLLGDSLSGVISAVKYLKDSNAL